MDKEPVHKKRRVCEDGSAAGPPSAGTSGTIDEGAGVGDLESKVKAMVEEAIRAHVARSSCTGGSSGKSGSGGDPSSGTGSSSSGTVGGMFG